MDKKPEAKVQAIAKEWVTTPYLRTILIVLTLRMLLSAVSIALDFAAYTTAELAVRGLVLALEILISAALWNLYLKQGKESASTASSLLLVYAGFLLLGGVMTALNWVKGEFAPLWVAAATQGVHMSLKAAGTYAWVYNVALLTSLALEVLVLATAAIALEAPAKVAQLNIPKSLPFAALRISCYIFCVLAALLTIINCMTLSIYSLPLTTAAAFGLAGIAAQMVLFVCMGRLAQDDKNDLTYMRQLLAQ